MTPDYLRYPNNYNNLNNVINNLINNLNNTNIINHPIDQIVPRVPVGIAVVDGYVFNGWDEDPIVVTGRLVNECPLFFAEAVSLPFCEPVAVGRPIFPPWALDVCPSEGVRI